MKFYSIGLHIGVRDIQYIFEQLGHELVCDSLSDHNYVLDWKDAQNDVINKHNWRELNKDLCRRFYQRYSREFLNYDGFLTFYPPAFAQLFEHFSQKTICCIPLRYEMPYMGNSHRWQEWTNFLQNGVDRKRIIPVTNNLFDQKYLELLANRHFELISGLCEYTGAKYTGKNDSFLYCSKFGDFQNWIGVPNIVSKPSNYSWQQIADFKAIIYIPYTNITMSLFEQYTANIPLLLPTKEYLVQLWEQYGNSGVMSELSHMQVFGLQPRTPLDCGNTPDPNDYKSRESFEYWSALSEFYNDEMMPYIEYFDSVSELRYKLLTLDFQEISAKMAQFNKSKKERTYFQWRRVIEDTIV